MGYGNTSVSALLSQARAALKKQQSLEEQVAAYEYDLSPKDQAAFDKYSSFIDNRVKQVKDSDPSKALSLQRLQTGAQRSFTSSEIQRQSINIAEGKGSKQGKLQAIIGLYRKALENGDEATAQRLQLQADTLQIQIQNEANAGAGKGGGGSDAADKAAKKGINAQLDKIQTAKKDFKDDLAAGRITSKDYIAKNAQLFDAQNKILQSTYQVDGNGNIVQNQNSGLSYESVKDYYDKHNSLRQDNLFQQIMGTNPNVPLELRMEQIGNAFRSSIDPLSGEVKLEPNNIVGMRRLTEYGSNLAAPTVENNVDSKKYTEAFKSLGIDGGSSGSVKKGYTDYAGNQREAPFYLSDPEKPDYAYTQDENGVRYALNKDGKAVMLGDSAAASKSIAALQERLANPNISPQEREAIQNDIRNTNTDLVPDGVISGIKGVQQQQQDEQLAGLAGFGRKLVAAGDELVSKVPGGTDVQNVYSKSKIGNLTNEILRLGGSVTGLPLGLAAGAQGLIGGIGGLTKKVGELKVQAEQKAQAVAAQRAAEFQANQQAIQAANAQQAAYQAQVAAQNRQSVALPYKATPAGQAAANTIGSSAFNDKYLGSTTGSLYNKYLR